MMLKTLKAADHCTTPLNASCTSVTPKAVLTNALLYCLTLLTVMLNLLLIISISHFRQLHTCTNLILLSLAVSDLMVGLVAMPAAIIHLHASCGLQGQLSCAFLGLLNFTLTSASVGNMVLIAVDRYVAICHPLRYSSMITQCRVKTCVYLCWLCSVIYNVTVLKGQLSQVDLSDTCYHECVITINYISGVIDLFLTFIGPVSVIILLYMRVFAVALSQARAVRSHISAVQSNTVRVKKSELRAATTLGITLFVFILCLCPYYIPSIAGQETVGGVDSSAPLWLFYSNSSFNPLIYAFFYNWFRKAVKLIVSLQILQPGSRNVKIT